MTGRKLDWSLLSPLVGSPLLGVRYLQLLTDDIPANWSLNPNFDSVDVAVELTAEGGNGAVVEWKFDDVTEDYALDAYPIPFAGSESAVAVDVATNSRWKPLIGVAVESIDEATWERDAARDTSYPPALVIRFVNGESVTLAAADYDVSRGRLNAGTEGVTVFFSQASARAAGIRIPGDRTS